MANGVQFSKNIRKRGRQVENSSARAVRRAGRAFLKAAVLATPVDKGVARSNWRVGVGGVPRAVIKAYRPYPRGSKANGAGSGERANAIATIAAGYARIALIRGIPGAGLKKSLTIVNNTPYINQIGGPAIVSNALSQARGSIKGLRVFGGFADGD